MNDVVKACIGFIIFLGIIVGSLTIGIFIERKHRYEPYIDHRDSIRLMSTIKLNHSDSMIIWYLMEYNYRPHPDSIWHNEIRKHYEHPINKCKYEIERISTNKPE